MKELSAIARLTPRELEEPFPQPIDAQLKADLDTGRIDVRIDRALPDH